MTFHDFFHELSTFSMTLGLAATLNISQQQQRALFACIQAHTVLQIKAMFRNQHYNTGQLRYFDNNLLRTSKQAKIYFMNCILIK